MTAILLAAALATWIVAVERMRGMDAGPGTDLGALGWFIGIWVTMMAAMMLPSAEPMVLLFDRISGERAQRGRASVPTWIFVSGYLATWTVYGLAVFALGVMRLVWMGIVAALIFTQKVLAADQARMRMMHLEQRVPMDRPDSEMEPSDEMSP